MHNSCGRYNYYSRMYFAKLSNKSSRPDIFCKKVVLRNFTGKSKSQENTLTRDSFLTKLPASSCNFIKKEALAQVFSCEFCEISRKLFFIEHLCWLLLLYQRKKCFCKTIHSEINLKSKQNRITMFYSPYVATKSICFKISKV